MPSPTNLTLTLTEILQGVSLPFPSATVEHAGDQALFDEDWSKAIAAYEHCDEGSVRVDEKWGWCLVQSEAWSDATALLSPQRDRLSSTGLAALAVASVGGWSARYRLDEPKKALLEELLGEALANDGPAYLAYVALFWFKSHRRDGDALLAHAGSAVSLYPDSCFFRLQLAECIGRQGGDEAERYAVLEAGLGANVTTEYLWTCASSAERLARWDDALAYLERALAMTIAHGERARTAAQQLRIKKAEILISAGRAQEAVALYRELATLDVAADRDIVLVARRALLAIACRGGDAERTDDALRSWLAVAIPSLGRFTFSDLLEGEYEPLRFFDGEVGGFAASESLVPYLAQLLGVAEANERGLVRFLFAGRERESDDDYDRQAFAEAMLEAAEETSDPVILAALATAYAVKKRPHWRLAGSTWARCELRCLSAGSQSAEAGPLDAVDSPSVAAIEAYAKGMREVFEQVAPSPHLAEIFSSLRDVLSENKIYRAFRELAELAALESEDPNVIFFEALGAHWCRDHGRAITRYWDVLSRDQAHYSSLHNLLLLYRAPQYAAATERVAALVEALPADESEARAKLLGLLADARDACRDPNDAIRAAIRRELGQYPTLIKELPKAAKIPLQDAVTLMTLMRMCDPADGSLVLEPFGQSGKLFSPTVAHRKGLFRLLQTGLVAIDEDTPPGAFEVNGERVRGYRFDRMWWRVSPATLSLTQSIEELATKSVWPRAWSEAARPLAEAIAEEECVQYLMHVADDRGWPSPDDDAKVHALAKSLVRQVSVSQAFYLIYLGAMAASDHKQRHPVSNQQASNVIVLRASQRLETWMSESRQLRSYSRCKHVPRSVISQVFHDEFLGVGERAFSERVGELPYPGARKRRART